MSGTIFIMQANDKNSKKKMETQPNINMAAPPSWLAQLAHISTGKGMSNPYHRSTVGRVPAIIPYTPSRLQPSIGVDVA